MTAVGYAWAVKLLPKGTVIAERYCTESVLGQGAFGVTYRARDLGSAEEVAVKRINLRDLGDWKHVELFEREAEALKRLNHPQIPAYIDFLPVEADRAGFLVQGLAPGSPLQSFLDDGEVFSEEQVEDIARQVLGILVYLSEQKPPMIHRDVKPANLIMDMDGTVRLVDFGAVTSAASKTTAVGSTVAGTFGYMAPEQVQGAIEARSDQYAVGMTMIALLTGMVPTDIPRHRLKPRFSEVVRVSPGLARVIDRLIEPVPDDRFPTASDAVLALGDLEAERASSAATAGDIGSLIAARELAIRQSEREAEARERKSKQRAIEKVQRVDDRVSIRGVGGALDISIAPESLGAHVKKLFGGPLLFLWINPGVFVAMGLVVVLKAVVSLSLLALIPMAFGLWTCLLLAGAVGLAKLSQKSTRLQLTPKGEFSLTVNRAKRPELFGHQSDLVVNVSVPTPGELGDCIVRDQHSSVRVENLNPQDLSALRQALKRFC